MLSRSMPCALCVLGLLAIGCEDPAQPLLQLDSVVPSSGPFGVLTEIEIRGHFPPRVRISYADPSRSEVDTDFGAQLGTVQLLELHFVDSETLRASVPASLLVGVHRLTVTDPFDRRAFLDEAFTVHPSTTLPDGAVVIADVAGVDVDGVDAGERDVGTNDIGTADVGVADVGATDAGTTDAGTTDVGVADVGVPDTGIPDSATPDTVLPDAALPDTAAPDLARADSAVSGNTPPIPVITITPAAGTPADTYTGDATASWDREDGTTGLSYAWDWDDDGSFDSTQAVSTWDQLALGTQRVVLRVTDSGGLSAYAFFEVIVAASGDLLLVTTGVDEEDPGATPASPGGVGFSVREALNHASSQTGRQTVLVPPGVTVAVTTVLNNFSGADGVDLVGDGAVIDGSAAGPSSSCILVAISNVRVFGLELANCHNVAIQVGTGTTDNQIARCYIHDAGNTGGGVYLQGNGTLFGPGNEVASMPGVGMRVDGLVDIIDSSFHHITLQAVQLDRNADTSEVRGNSFWANGVALLVDRQCVDPVIAHNSFHGSTTTNVEVDGSSSGVIFQNNAVIASAGAGMVADSASFTLFDHNAFFGNLGGDCTACAALGVDDITDDPQLVDPAAGDLRLEATSPLIDRGASLGHDVNGAAPGDHNGAGPDIGAHEVP